MHTSPTTCTRCRRPLKATASVTRGMGATCARRTRQEQATAAIKPETVAKAREILELGALIATGRTTRTGLPVFEVVSSSGASRYLASPAACRCKAGMRGRVCAHRTAVTITAA